MTSRHVAFALATLAEVAAGVAAATSTGSAIAFVVLGLAFVIGASAPRWFGPAVALLAVVPGVVIGASQPGEDSFGYTLGMDTAFLIVLVATAAIGLATRGLLLLWMRRRGRGRTLRQA